MLQWPNKSQRYGTVMDCGGGDRRGRALVHVRNNLNDPTPDKPLDLVPGAVEDARRAMLRPLVLRAGFLSAPERETKWRAFLTGRKEDRTR